MWFLFGFSFVFGDDLGGVIGASKRDTMPDMPRYSNRGLSPSTYWLTAQLFHLEVFVNPIHI